jgi:hypothetical protein
MYESTDTFEGAYKDVLHEMFYVASQHIANTIQNMESNDSWTFYLFGLNLLALRLQCLLITINKALSLIYTIYSTPLHTH